jgi:uncharacterized protein (TIGR02453 family)
MIYFTKDFINFFNDLEKNNNKEWFHANKKRYETYVKKPMQEFMTDLIAELQKFDVEIDADPKKCIGRINRDVRFSNDKTPYNVRMMAHIYKGTKTDPLPVIAFQLGATEMAIMSGYYNPEKEKIQRIRDKIKSDTATFKKIYSDKEFVSKFGTICGESLKRIPAEYQETFELEPLVANKQFYFMKKLNSDLILTDELLRVLIDHYKVAKPVNEFFS